MVMELAFARLPNGANDVVASGTARVSRFISEADSLAELIHFAKF